MMHRSLVIGLVGTWVAALGGQGQAPVFRVAAESVAVNVSVKQGNAPVQGLTAGSFRLYDNDVLQEVAAVGLDAVPVEVSFVVDTSGSAFADLDAARTAVREMAAMLRPSDRFRVLTMGNAVINAIPWRDAGMPDTSRIDRIPGQISLISDAILLALFHRPSPERRHLVVALTDGDDLCSLMPGERLRQGAERSGAVFHWVSVQRTAAERDSQPAPRTKTDVPPIVVEPGVRSTCATYRATDLPTNLRPFLSAAARLTGGTTHVAWYSADRVAVEAFDRIFDDFRRSYVLSYIPTNVQAGGWHRLRVEVPGKDYTIRARPGYWEPRQAAGEKALSIK